MMRVYSGVTLNTLQMKFDGLLDKYWNLYKFLKLRTQFSLVDISAGTTFPWRFVSNRRAEYAQGIYRKIFLCFILCHCKP
jgi:hypothetical protein